MISLIIRTTVVPINRVMGKTVMLLLISKGLKIEYYILSESEWFTGDLVILFGNYFIASNFAFVLHIGRVVS